MNSSSESKPQPWGEYYKHHEGRPPRPEILSALELVGEDGEPLAKKSALEIGAGNMIEAKALLNAGLGHVTATDMSPGAEYAAASLEMDLNNFGEGIERFEYKKLYNEELAALIPPESLDLVASYFTLQFTNPSAFPELWKAIIDGLKPGGVLSVTLGGDRDSWKTSTLADGSPRYPGMTFCSREELDRLLEGMVDVDIREEEKDEPTNDGVQKHWHTYRVQARKPTAN